MDKETIAKRINKLCEKHEINIYELSKKTEPEYYLLEKLANPYSTNFYDIEAFAYGIKYMTAISEYFNVSLDYLILGKEEIKLDIEQAINVLNENNYRELERYDSEDPMTSGKIYPWYYDEGLDSVTYYNEISATEYTQQETIWIAEGILREKEKQSRASSVDMVTPCERSEQSSS